MISTQHTQSLTDFRQRATETLERLNKTGEAEILTVNGEARAVLMAPAAYDRLYRQALLAHDVTIIRRAREEIAAGKAKPADDFFDELRGEVLAKRNSPGTAK